MKTKLVIVADDFTGSNDTGVQFSKKNLKTIVLTDWNRFKEASEICDVIVVDTESRFDSKEEAYNKVFDLGINLKENKIKYVYKKIDSTFRGNIGGEISGVMDSIGTSRCILVPALPSNGRTTVNGKVYVKGVLLEDTEISKDPKTPVKKSFIPNIISEQTDKKVKSIDINEIRKGNDFLKNEIEELFNEGNNIIIIDAITEEDMELIASTISELKDNILYSGSAGLAEYLSKHLDIHSKKKSGVILAGSVSDVTRKQIEYAEKQKNTNVVNINLAKMFNDKKEEKNRILFLAEKLVNSGEDIIIRSAPSRESVKLSNEIGNTKKLNSYEVSDTIANFMGEIGKEIIRNYEISGMLMTGGDIAIKTINQLGISGTLIKNEITAGIPYGYFVEENLKDITIALKAGAFGNEDAIVKVLEFFRKGDE